MLSLPTVAMFQQIGQELRRRIEAGPKVAAKQLLRRFVSKLVVSARAINAELVIGSPRDIRGSDHEFSLKDRWWS
ncbi:MAG: hypothetical protein ACE147_17560 [Candidatus Methylomirabilales bacterium]